MLRTFFKVISIVLHPLLLPTYGTLLYLWANPSIEGKTPDFADEASITPSSAIIAIFINTFVMPAIAILTMKGLGFIKTFEMQDKQERIIPFIATMTFYIWTFLVAKNQLQFMLPTFTIFILGTVVSLMFSFFINIFFKLSIHMVGMAGLLTGTLIMMINSEKSLLGVFLLVIVLTGLIASARLYLKAHTPKELYVGFLIGISGQMLAFSLYSRFIM